MPPRDPALPEGTDHIIQGAAQLDGGAGGGGGNATAGGGSGSGFVASAGGGDDTGGTAGAGTGTSLASTGGGGGSSGGGSNASGGGLGAGAERIRTQVRDQIQSLRGQATDKVRQFADDGKGRATTMLDNLGGVIDDAARAIDERLGSEYSGYARRASTAVSSLSGTLRDKDLDDLLDDTRAAIKRSPGIAIGIAAIAGFALVRVLKTGLDESGLGGVTGGNSTGGGSSGGGSTGAGSGGSTGATGGGSGSAVGAMGSGAATGTGA